MRAFLLLICLSFSTWCAAGAGDAPLKFKHRAAKIEKASVIILLHGYGSNEADLFSLQLTSESHIFSLRAPYAHPHGGFSWFGLEFLGNGKFSFDYAQAKESRKKILDFISWACREYKADSTRVFVIGFSQGAMMCFDLALHAPEKFAGLAALSGGVIPESKNNVSKKIKGLNLFVGHGRLDEVVKYSSSTDASLYMTSLGALVLFKSYDQEHNISGRELSDLSGWIKTKLVK